MISPAESESECLCNACSKTNCIGRMEFWEGVYTYCYESVEGCDGLEYELYGQVMSAIDAYRSDQNAARKQVEEHADVQDSLTRKALNLDYVAWNDKNVVFCICRALASLFADRGVSVSLFANEMVYLKRRLFLPATWNCIDSSMFYYPCLWVSNLVKCLEYASQDGVFGCPSSNSYRLAVLKTASDMLMYGYHNVRFENCEQLNVTSNLNMEKCLNALSKYAALATSNEYRKNMYLEWLASDVKDLSEAGAIEWNEFDSLEDLPGILVPKVVKDLSF